MVECEICLEEYQEGHSELHLATCVLRLVFRCSVCGEDYVSREGLWNHLDLHEIVDDTKELHCQELKAKHKLHQCGLCNDQRGYSESSYWVHVQNFHGDILNPRIQMIASNTNVHSAKPNLKPSREQQNIVAHEGHDNPSNRQPCINLNNGVESTVFIKESRLIAVNSTTSKTVDSRLKCDECGKIFRSKSVLFRHKMEYHKTLQYECLTCGIPFYRRRDYNEHYCVCKQKMWLCDLCKRTFKRFKTIMLHNKRKHPKNGNSSTIQLVQRELRNDNPELENAALTSDDQVHATFNVSDSRTSAEPTPNITNNASLDGQVIDKGVNANSEKQIVPGKINISMKTAPHKLTCSSQTKESDDFRPVEIKVEETTMQYLDYQIPNEDQGPLLSTTLNLNGSQSNNVETKAAEGLKNEVQVKEELLGNVEETGIETQDPKESSECPIMCPICGLSFKTVNKLRYHKSVGHRDPSYECSLCQKKFHSAATLRSHKKGCSELRCYICDIKFRKRTQLSDHNEFKHPQDANLKQDEELASVGSRGHTTPGTTQ